MTVPTAKQLSEAIIGQIETVFNVRDRTGREEAAKVVEGLIVDYGDRRAAAQPSSGAESAEDDDLTYLIFFDDTDKRPAMIRGGRAARKIYADMSVSWNAYLFVLIDSNSRDNQVPVALLSAPKAEPNSEEPSSARP